MMPPLILPRYDFFAATPSIFHCHCACFMIIFAMMRCFAFRCYYAAIYLFSPPFTRHADYTLFAAIHTAPLRITSLASLAAPLMHYAITPLILLPLMPPHVHLSLSPIRRRLPMSSPMLPMLIRDGYAYISPFAPR